MSGHKEFEELMDPGGYEESLGLAYLHVDEVRRVRTPNPVGGPVPAKPGNI